MASGISSEHEAFSADEALEKVAAGLTVFIREGSAAKNLANLLPAVNDGNWEHFCFCTDDISVSDLLSSGDIVNCIRTAVALRMAPERAMSRLPRQSHTTTTTADFRLCCAADGNGTTLR